ncbi:MAG: caspase family protein [Leptolyngbyaceae cyanobacterium bins.302]|nr:caspase family protein [Leptolyngbyaceae cyanobacterium bins.302]
MNYKRGLQVLESFVSSESEEDWRDFELYKGQLLGNLREEERFGRTDTLQNERNRIIDKLNPLALKLAKVSFVDLCLGKQLPQVEQPPTKQKVGQKGDGDASGSKIQFGTGKKWAILVGANEYEDKHNYGSLQVCVKDAEAIHSQLLEGGFNSDRIRVITDDSHEIPKRNTILAALKATADATEPDDLLLFYYSGHGDEVKGESYLVVRDGHYPVLSDTAVPVSRVKQIMEEAPARAKVIILDACHSGADIGGKGPKKMSAEFIQRVFEQAEGFAILASCKQGQLSYEWRAQERSVFTHYLLEALSGKADFDKKGFVSVHDTNRYVVNGVKLWASQHNIGQTPTLEYAVAGDIILVKCQ